MNSHKSCLAVKGIFLYNSAISRKRLLCYACLCRRDKQSRFCGVTCDLPLTLACKCAPVAAFRSFLRTYLSRRTYDSAPQRLRESFLVHGIYGYISAFCNCSADPVAHTAEIVILMDCGNLRNCHFVLGYSACLVGAYHRCTAKRLNAVELIHKRLLLHHSADCKCKGNSHRCRKSLGNCRNSDSNACHQHIENILAPEHTCSENSYTNHQTDDCHHLAKLRKPLL